MYTAQLEHGEAVRTQSIENIIKQRGERLVARRKLTQYPKSWLVYRHKETGMNKVIVHIERKLETHWVGWISSAVLQDDIGYSGLFKYGLTEVVFDDVLERVFVDKNTPTGEYEV